MENKQINKAEGCTHCGGKSIYKMLVPVFLMIVIALGAYTYSAISETNYLSSQIATITVNGKGEILARPDIATFSFSVVVEEDDAATAQKSSAKAINEILAYLEEEGVTDKDVKTQYYNLSPRYDYLRSICTTDGFCPPSEQVLRGYEVNQTIIVKVRDIDNSGTLLSGVGTRGATNISSLQFTIDDEDIFVAEAREVAIDDAKEKAKKLANDLGVKLVRIVDFNESGRDEYYPPIMYERFALDSTENVGVAPSIPTGENTFVANVSITYEIR